MWRWAFAHVVPIEHARVNNPRHTSFALLSRRTFADELNSSIFIAGGVATIHQGFIRAPCLIFIEVDLRVCFGSIPYQTALRALKLGH